MTDDTIGLICIGDELLDGSIRDLNLLRLGDLLSGVGLRLDRARVVPDSIEAIAQALDTIGTATIVVSGGLGPTQDDITRDGAARWANTELSLDPDSLETLEARFRDRGRTFTQNNRRQAYFPMGARALPNPMGSAPGFALSIDDQTAYFFPGVPSEFQACCETHLLPHVKTGSSARTRLYFHGLGESQLENQLEGIEALAQHAGAKIGYRADYPVIEVKLVGPSKDHIAELEAFVIDRIGSHYIGRDKQTQAHRVGELLSESDATVTTAESCTAGGIAAAITDIAGSSGWFEEGFVTYSNRAKVRLLGVLPDTLARFGAVSAATVCQMACGARERSGADYGIAVSGIAGPGGGTAEKPVGTVYFGLSTPQGTYYRLVHFPVSTRDRIRAGTVCSALAFLTWCLDGTLDTHEVHGPFALEEVMRPQGIPT